MPYIITTTFERDTETGGHITIHGEPHAVVDLDDAATYIQRLDCAPAGGFHVWQWLKGHGDTFQAPDGTVITVEQVGWEDIRTVPDGYPLGAMDDESQAEILDAFNAAQEA